MSTSAQYGSLPFNQQIDFFQSKLNIPSERWSDIWQNAHNTGFAVAGAMKADLLNDFRQAVNAAIAEGKSITWFKSEFNAIVAKHGWSHTGKADWRARVIYNTNMRQSYNAGRYEQLQKFPYWRYAHGDSRYPRELHLSWHGLILPKDSPWWQTHFPQNGWGCKCRVYGISEHEFHRQGLRQSTAPDDGTKQWLDKNTGEVHEVPTGIDPGFDYVPKREAYQQKQQALVEAKQVFEPSERIAPSSYSTLKGVNNASLNTVLNAVKQTSSGPQIEQLGQFLNQYQIKSVFIKQAEMGPRNAGAKAIEAELEQYLDKSRYQTRQLYTINGYRNTWGFTAKSFNHVTIKVPLEVNLNKVEVNELRQVMSLAIKFKQNGQMKFSLSSVAREFAEGKHSTGTVITWLHEIGHLLHFKAGSPRQPVIEAMTTYSNKDRFEWHAEHFAAWVLNRNELMKFSPQIVEHFDNLMASVLANGA